MSPYKSLLATGLALVAATTGATLESQLSASISTITPDQWSALNSTVNGRLYKAAPFARPCFSRYNGEFTKPDAAQCKAVQAGYTKEMSIADSFAGFQNSNWATCQANGQGCGLNFNAPQDPTYYADPKNCYQGSIPSYYIDVQEVSDVQAGLKFASDTGIPLVVKNSGHDYKGRSSAPNALSLWTHNIQTPIKLTRGFTPDGCSAPAGDAVTLPAGQGFKGVYEFAEANNITVLGGSSSTVGPVGGWINGGGHGALSNTLGLGVDNVLEIKTVLPSGEYVTANRCQNQDIFFALRGGGGSAFGVNMEMTTTAHPQMSLEVVYIIFASLDLDSRRKLVKICAQNADKWATEGWGGYIAPGAKSTQTSGLILMTPKLTHAEAVISMKPLTNFAASLLNLPQKNGVHSEPSFYQAYQKYIVPNQEEVGLGIAVGSRLIPRASFQSASGQEAVTNAIIKASNFVTPVVSGQIDLRQLTYSPPLQILVTAPSSYQTDNTSSVTPAWYGPNGAVWHVLVGQCFANDATASEIQDAFSRAHNAADVLRAVAPDSGAYQNEADIFEPSPEDSFWGQENYQKLLGIKQQIDPNNVLTCWGCVGWDKSDARYSCYPSI